MRSLFFRCRRTRHSSSIVYLSLLLLLNLLICDYSAVLGSNTKRRGERVHHVKDAGDDEGWETRSLALLPLFDNDDVISTNEYDTDNNLDRNRVVRSPLDDEIDEAEDSEEDEEEEEDPSPEKNKTTSTHPTTTTVEPTHITIAPLNKPFPSNPMNRTIQTRTDLANSQITGSTSLHLDFNRTAAGGPKNSTGGRHVPLHPPGLPLKPGIPPNRGTQNRRPFPGGPPQIHGNLPPLPPHLLKNLPKPKPPPKKGELYLPEDYNNLVIPKLNLGKLIGIDSYSAVPVLVFLNIRSVRDIDESMETLTLDLDLVIEWVDGFLFDPISAITSRQADITLNPIFLKKIWRPDIYIDEIVKVKRTSLMSKPLKLKFNPSNGFISYTTRLTVQLSCDMLYFYYPADTHRCEFTFRSYSYFSKDMELSWLGTGVYLQDPYDPNFDLQVESIDRVKLPQTFRKLTNDTFDGLKFTLLARRKLSFHMVQTYLPSIFFIVITWLCFLVPARMVEARIGISMTTLLTLTSMFASVRESTPIVSYVKAIDIWMVFCIFFVFLTLLEFATLVWLRSRREDAEEKKLEQQRKDQDKQQRRKNGKDLEANLSRHSSTQSVELLTYERFAEFTEKFAFVIFSIVFLVFNVIYWSWLLTASDYCDWNVNSTLNADLD